MFPEIFIKKFPVNNDFLHFFSLCSYSPKPTLEEVESWGQSFDKLMKSPAGRNAFRGFLRTEYSEENMLFWLACEDLKNEVNNLLVKEKARLIYEDYISILSPKEVSLCYIKYFVDVKSNILTMVTRFSSGIPQKCT